MSFPGWQYFICVVTHHCQETQALSIQFRWKKTTRSLCLLSWTLPYVPFFFADFNLYPFIRIHHSHEQNTFLSFVSPFSKSSNLRIVPRSPSTVTNNLQLLNEMYNPLSSLRHRSSLLKHLPIEVETHTLPIFPPHRLSLPSLFYCFLPFH